MHLIMECEKQSLPGQITPEYFLSQLHDVRRERRNKKYPHEKRGSTDKLLRIEGLMRMPGTKTLYRLHNTQMLQKTQETLWDSTNSIPFQSKGNREFYPILLECENWFARKSKDLRKRERKEQLIYQKDD